MTPRGGEDASTPSANPKTEDVDKVLARLVRDLKALVYHLRGVEVIDDEHFYNAMLTFCSFCGSVNENGMHISEQSGRLICRSCGATV